MQTKLYVLYGGKSVEHEVSLKTAYTVIQSIDNSKFEVFPIYITREGLWCSPDKLNQEGLQLNDLIALPKHRSEAESIGQVLMSQFALPGKKLSCRCCMAHMERMEPYKGCWNCLMFLMLGMAYCPLHLHWTKPSQSSY